MKKYILQPVYYKKIFILILIISALFTIETYASVANKSIYIQNSSYSVIAYIEPDGTVCNSSNSIIGYMNSDGSILNSSHSGIGYIESDGRILNSFYSKIACLYKDTLLTPSNSPIAYIKRGYVVDGSNKTVLYFDEGIEKKWIAAYLMFFY